MKKIWKRVWAWARSRKLEQSFFDLAQGDLVEKAKACLIARERLSINKTRAFLLEKELFG